MRSYGYKADFGILTSTRTLYLVEIEKPQTTLVKKNGGIHSELQAGFDQIRSWNVIVQDHRTALLDELQLRSDEVHDVKFMLVAGLSSNTSREGMSMLRRTSLHDVAFYCFDELAAFLHRLGGDLSSL